MHKAGADKGFWDGTICIVKDRRRALYCANELLRTSQPDTEVHKFALMMVRNLETRDMIDYQHAWSLESKYRVYVLKQRTMHTTAWQ